MYPPALKMLFKASKTVKATGFKHGAFKLMSHHVTV